MFELIAENAILKGATLLALFIGVVAAVYFAGMAFTARQVTRHRLIEPVSEAAKQPSAAVPSAPALPKAPG